MTPQTVQTARSYLLTGDDSTGIRSRRAQLLAAAGVTGTAVERYDLTDDATHPTIIAALTTPSLFGDARFIEVAGADQLTSDVAAALGDVPGPDTVVVWGARVPAAVAKTIPSTVCRETFALSGDPSRRLRQIADEHRVTLSSEALDRLRHLAGHDLAAATSIVVSLAVTGVSAPSASDVDRFAGGSSPAPGTVWAVADAVADGSLRAALTLADTLEPLAVLSYLGTRTGHLGRIVDASIGTPEEAAAALGLPSVTAGRRLVSLAGRLGSRGVAESWRILAAADVATKRAAEPRMVLDQALVRLTRLWSAEQERHATLPALVP